MKTHLFTEGTGPIFELPNDDQGRPYDVKAGDYIRINNKTYEVTSTLWNFDEPAYYIAAVEEKEEDATHSH